MNGPIRVCGDSAQICAREGSQFDLVLLAFVYIVGVCVKQIDLDCLFYVVGVTF